jgi:hypothetical protein
VAMFNRRTLFILGAGASAEVGLPAGPGLALDIRKRLNVTLDHFGRLKAAGDDELATNIFQNNRPAVREYALAFRTIREGILLSNSIDDFLNIHSGNSHLVEAGKAAIVSAILQAEAHSDLYVNPSNANNKLNYEKIAESWFLKFMRVLGPGIVAKDAEFALDNVSFIVFNYDRCLEHFLSYALPDLYGVSKPDALKMVGGATIIHPYGSIGTLEKVPFGGDENQRFDYLALGNEIRTYAEQFDAGAINARIQKAVAEAACVVFLGFAYHDQNMMLLKPEARIDGRHFFGTAFGMSEADRQVVIRQLGRFFTTSPGVTPTDYIRIENTLKCAGLFSHYAKSLAG